MVSSNDVQRLFLQSVLSRRVLSQKLAVKIWEKCVAAVQAADASLDIPFSNTRDAWDAFVTEINTTLNPLNLEFAHMHDEGTGKEMYAMVNRQDDEIAQTATGYSAIEITYFKAVVEQIMLAPNESYCVSSLAALREVNAMKANMTKSQAEVVLNSFVARGWLMRSRKGRYSLSTRTLIELQPYLKNTYPDEILECTICLDMLTRGIACYTPQCKARLHNHCYNAYRRVNKDCPTCKKDWSSAANANKIVPVGEGAFREGQDKGKRRVRRNVQEEGSDEDAEGEGEEMDVDEPSQPSQSQPKRTQSQRKGKKKAIREESMDLDEKEDDEPEASPPPRTQKRKGRR